MKEKSLGITGVVQQRVKSGQKSRLASDFIGKSINIGSNVYVVVDYFLITKDRTKGKKTVGGSPLYLVLQDTNLAKVVVLNAVTFKRRYDGEDTNTKYPQVELLKREGLSNPLELNTAGGLQEVIRRIRTCIRRDKEEYSLKAS